LFVEDFIIPDMTCFFIPFNNHDITPILNSSMFKFLASNYCPILGNFKTGGRIRYKSTYMSKIPFPKNVIKSKFTEKAIGAITSRKELLKLKQGLINLLQSKYVLDKVSGKLENWNQLDFSDFLKELKKQKIKLSLSEQAEWMEYFETEKEKALIIQAEIDRTDVEIDKIVYELYGLTDEEVAIVEAATA